MRISFGPFAFDPQSRLLWRDGAEIALPPRVLGVLEVLIERSGDVVARQDLLDRVWKDAFVTDTSLAEAVSFLRSALGDDPQSPQYIQTVHRRGYRFLVTPTTEPVVEPGSAGGRPGSNEGQTGVRLGSDHLRSIAASGQLRSIPAPGQLRSTPASGHVGSIDELDADSAANHVDWQLVPWIAATLCAALAIATVWHAATAPAPPEPPVVRAEIRTTAGTTFDAGPRPIAISPDGRSLAWSACDAAGGRCAIYLRALDALDARTLAGTDGGHSPVFSPDGRWIAFFADGALKKIAVAGGAPSVLATAPDPGGAAWAEDGRIAFSGSAAAGLSIVNGQGGAVQALTTPRRARGELRHRDPAWLPDGRLLFTIASAPGADLPGELAAVQTPSNDIRILRNGVTRGAPTGSGYLLLATPTDLQAATFDDRALVLTGSTDAVPAPASDGAPRFAAGASALAIVRSAGDAQRIWNDGADAAPFARLSSIALSSDSRHAAGVIVENDTADIWTVDLGSNALTRLTFGGTNVSPAWSADGQRLLFSTRDAAGVFQVVSRSIVDRTSAAAATPAAPAHAFPSSTAADGRVALTVYNEGRTAIAIVSPGGAAPRILTDGPFDEAAAAFSPDGRWLALESSESGRTDVIARSATGGQRFSISTDGGRHPRWSEDGRSIYFDAGRRLMKAGFRPEEGGAVGRPEPVLDRAGERVLAVAPSGRVLVERRPPADTAVLILQWLRELRERLPLPVTSPR